MQRLSIPSAFFGRFRPFLRELLKVRRKNSTHEKCLHSRYIVQAEFLHAGRTSSLEAAQRECNERLADGSAIRTTVRYHDADGFIASETKRMESVDTRREALTDTLIASEGRRRKALDRCTRQLAGEGIRNREQLARVVVNGLERAMQARRPIAIDDNASGFRLLHRDEMYELLESARKASHVWVFVFLPDDLLSNHQQIYARVM